MEFTWFDGVLLGLIVLSLVLGMIKGLLREVVSLVSLFLSVVLAFKLAEPLGTYLTWWQSEGVRYVAAFIIIAIAVLVVGVLVGLLLKNIAKDVGLGGLDHGLGAVFGFIRGSLVALVIVFLLSNTAIANSDWYKNSVVQSWFHGCVVWLQGFSPHDLQKPVHHLKGLKQHALVRHIVKHVKQHAGFVNNQLQKG